MRAIAKGIGLLLLAAGLFGLWYLIVSQGWWPRLSEEQKAAVALMEQPMAVPPGENALVMAELIRHDVPEADYPKWKTHGPIGLEKALVAAGHQRLVDAETSDACGSSSADCLSAVLDDPESARQKRETFAVVISRLPLLFRSTHASIRPAPPEVSLEDVPPGSGLGTQVAELDAALMFADGDIDGAVDSACRQAAFWRGLVANSDTLIAQLIAGRHAIRAGELLNGMVLREPLRAKPSPACLAAFRPFDADERSLCDAMRGEYAWVTSFDLQAAVEAEQSWLSPRMNKAHNDALAAWTYSQLCDEGYVAAVRKSDFATLKALECSWSEYLFNPPACMLFQIGQPAYFDYVHRLDDYSSNLSAIRAAISINARADGVSLDEAFAQRPDGDQREQQRIDVAEDGSPVLALSAGALQRHYRFTPLLLREDVEVVSDEPTGSEASEPAR
ncbi:MAG: hypothetical protein KDI75_06200 [Xanthomonadales bacterium]|nr:hypothetical protein [Xanthomonadales bacterium]